MLTKKQPTTKFLLNICHYSQRILLKITLNLNLIWSLFLNKIFSEFPCLRKTILDADFPFITLKMAKGDMEPYVRAGAYKCLREMVEINEFWSNLSKNDTPLMVSMAFYSKIVKIQTIKQIIYRS